MGVRSCLVAVWLWFGGEEEGGEGWIACPGVGCLGRVGKVREEGDE